MTDYYIEDPTSSIDETLLEPEAGDVREMIAQITSETRMTTISDLFAEVGIGTNNLPF